jgi:osmotically-inducible protein OsmY
MKTTKSTTKRTDTDLQNDVVAEISFDPAITASEIGVTCQNGVVTLSGSVPTYAERTFAEEATKRISGVHAFTDEITVNLPGMHIRNDRDIAGAVLDALKWDVTVDDASIKTKVDNGWVTIEGQAEWQYQINGVTRAIQFITGVRGVTNNLTIKPQIVAGDILSELERTFKRSAEIDADRIKIEVYDSNVTLRGTVSSWGEYDDATDAAYSLAGVTGVHNLITVGN